MPACHGFQDCCIQWPWAHGRPRSTHASAGDSWTLTGRSGSVFCGVTAPFSWVLVCTRFCLYPPRVCFPSPVGVLQSNPTGLQSQIPWEFSVPLFDPQVGKSVVSSRTFATVWELLWFNCSPVYGLSAWWLCSGANGGLLQGDLCHNATPPRSAAARAPVPVAGHCWPMPFQETLKHSKAGLAQSLVGSLGPGMHKVLFETSEHLWKPWGLILSVIFSPPTLVEASLLPLDVGSFLGRIQHSPVSGCSAVSCSFGVLRGEDERMSFYSAIF